MSVNPPCNSRTKTLLKICIYLCAHLFSDTFASMPKVSTPQNLCLTSYCFLHCLFETKYLCLEGTYKIIECQSWNESVRAFRPTPLS